MSQTLKGDKAQALTQRVADLFGKEALNWNQKEHIWSFDISSHEERLFWRIVLQWYDDVVYIDVINKNPVNESLHSYRALNDLIFSSSYFWKPMISHLDKKLYLRFFGQYIPSEDYIDSDIDIQNLVKDLISFLERKDQTFYLVHTLVGDEPPGSHKA